MQTEEERKERDIGLEMAQNAEAPDTATVIEDSKSCFEHILQTAADEVGIDRLTSYLLKGPPEWAYQALLIIPDLKGHRAALAEHAASDPLLVPRVALTASDRAKQYELASDITAPPSQPPTSGDVVSAIWLQNKGGYVAWLKMRWWRNGEFIGVSDNRTGRILYNKSKCVLGSYYKVNKEPPQDGDIVQVVVDVLWGNPVYASWGHTYRAVNNPNGNNAARVKCHGTNSQPNITELKDKIIKGCAG